MSTKLKPIPDFASEEEERQFWQTHDSTEYVDWSKAERVRLLQRERKDFVSLRPAPSKDNPVSVRARLATRAIATKTPNRP